MVCFAGVGTGEVSVGDRKLVGLSQRRTRTGARFQCLVHLAWEPDRWWPLVREDRAARPRRGDRPRRWPTGWRALGHVDDQGAEVRDLLVAALMGELLALEQQRPP